MKQVCDGVSKEYFYGAVWRCVLNNPSVRLAAITFVTSQVNRKKSLDDQMFILGSNVTTMVNAVCTSLLDPIVLVQRAILDFLLACFPLHETQIHRDDYVEMATAAVTVLLRRDISLNRRLFSWLFGQEVTPQQPKKSKRKRDAYFEAYSRDKIAAAFIHCLTVRSSFFLTRICQLVSPSSSLKSLFHLPGSISQECCSRCLVQSW